MHIKWLELILVAGVALGIGFWQLYDVNKALKEDKEKTGQGSADVDQPSSGAHDPASKTPDQISDVSNKRDH